MEGGEGSNQFHAGGEKLNTQNDQNDDSPREMVRPSTSLNASNNDASASASVPVKRGPGRPPKGPEQRPMKLKRSDANQGTGNSEIVSSLMMRFDAVRRYLSQSRPGKGEVFVAVDTFKKLQLRTNTTKRVGSVPGVNVGDIFFLWGEMELVGLHGVPIGIDTMGKNGVDDTPLAISVVSSGKNADKGDDPETLILTGLGGTGKTSGQASDQRLEATNLSLEKSLREKSPVRVTRAVEDVRRTAGKIYIYDGLYTITDMWDEKSEAGFKVFKFRLLREPDQKNAFGIWKSVEQWKKGLVKRPGLVLEDLSHGAENLKVTLVNEVDDEKGPDAFSYITSLKQCDITVPPMVELCTCQSRSCSVDCVCIQRNGGELPYVENILVTRGEIVYECGDSCPCFAICKNKMIHTGLKFSLEVFKTMDCGWGLRSWDPIRAGSFICQYAGEIIEKAGEEDGYVFDTSRVYKPFEWNYEPELIGRDASEKVLERIDGLPAFVISAKESGNVARFINHSCSPNVFWQTIAREEKGVWCLYIGFFAMKHIPPLTS
ncbi:unnamed protein product [Microthlaspi erraticum]|uniref:SET domain-containing protein n=1 Tax=Microthlaspi erraticum TaxID=1685480 RepID=A0A6D2ID66_9BRAS|nr:unnamed protein product [Microthlaspi erraticum]